MRSISKRTLLSLCALLLIASVARAQPAPSVQLAAPRGQQQPPPPSGTVTGHIYCNDTQRPARFAEVELLRETQPRNSNSVATPAPSYQAIGRARSALDGSFTLSNVPAGDYYVMGRMAGYVSPMVVARLTSQPIRGVPMVHVEANRSADAQVSMERGAVLTGRVFYDDGSPVTGAAVRLYVAESESAISPLGGLATPGFGGFDENTRDITDDRGVYRLDGVAPGHYIIAATVQTESSQRPSFAPGRTSSFSSSLSVFAPGTMHKADARVLEVRGTETIEGVDLQVALVGLHTIRGAVQAKSDGHAFNSGMATLIDATDSSFYRTAWVGIDGTFDFEYIPAGNYTLTASGSDRNGEGGRRGGGDGKSYQLGHANVLLGDHDVTVDTFQLDERKPAGAAN